MGALEHPNIIPVHHLAADARGEPNLVMKRVTGRPWGELLVPGVDRRTPPLDHDMSDDEVLDFHIGVLMQLCNAVEYAHSRGVVHRDIKPDNVMLGEFGEIYLMDWGIAVAVDPDDGEGTARDETSRATALGLTTLERAARVQKAAGTPAYMAPEMIDPTMASIGRHSDVYLLGATLHEVVTGEPPHRGHSVMAVLVDALRERPREYPPEVDPELVAIIETAMSPRPDARFDSVRDFRNALADYLRHRDSRTLTREADERLERLEHWVERHEPGGEDDTGTALEMVEARIAELYAECRFACEQALRTWDGNPRATEVRDRAIEVLARHELDAERPAAARRLLAELATPPEALRERLAELEHAQRASRRELERLRRDADVAAGSRERATLLIVLGTIAVLLVASSFVAEGPWFGVARRALFLVAIVTALVVTRRTVLANRTNRRFLVGATAMVATSLFIRIVRVAEGVLSVPEMMRESFALFAVGTAVLAGAVDWRLSLGAATFAGAWSGILFWPHAVIPIAIAGYATAFGVTWYAWRRMSRESSE